MFPPATESEIKEMLSDIGANSVEELFADIPKEARLNGILHLPPSMPEAWLRRLFSRMASKNSTLDERISFLGAGVYRHHIPAAILPLISRGEFATAYTPYQAEASQGTLQAVYEYQTLMCELIGMDTANASHYDGATALAESAYMAIAITNRETILASRAIHPQYRQVAKTYLDGRNAIIEEVPLEEGITSLQAAEKKLSSGTAAALLVQYPNFFGSLEPLEKLSELCSKHGALLIVSVVEPMAFGVLKPPGDRGAAIVAGEGASLGIPPSFGGPHVGFIATKKEHIRRLPGRIVGQTVDRKGKTAYTLTLQAREQHIRREKASSNICTNQSLLAVANAIYLSILGKDGFKEASAQCYHKAHYAHAEWTKSGVMKSRFKSPFYHEFVLDVPDAPSFVSKMRKAGIEAGYLTGNDYPEFPNSILFTVTEVNRRDEIDRFTKELAAYPAQVAAQPR